MEYAAFYRRIVDNLTSFMLAYPYLFVKDNKMAVLLRFYDRYNALRTSVPPRLCAGCITLPTAILLCSPQFPRGNHQNLHFIYTRMRSTMQKTWYNILYLYLRKVTYAKITAIHKEYCYG